MGNDTARNLYAEYLYKLPITVLRIVGRSRGVPHSSARTKDDLISAICDVLTGVTAPAPPSNKGAPVKQDYLDPAIERRLAEIAHRLQEPRDTGMEVHAKDGEPYLYDAPVYTGVLELTSSGYGFLRAKNCQPTSVDVFVPAPFIQSMQLREGDYVACTAMQKQQNGSAAISELLSVNGLAPGQYADRPHFEDLTACFPQEKIELGGDRMSPVSTRMLDLFAPIGKGQRALLIAPPKTGKTTLLKEIACAIRSKHPELVLILLLIDERPEEVTDIRASVEGAEVIYSTFDEGAERHIRAARLTIAHAKRLVEEGKDVVLLLDSLTKLTRACNYLTESSGKILSGGLDASAFAEPKRFFGAARNTKEAGSLTIIASALIDTGSRMDEVIYEEFKGTGNCDIFLSRDLAEKRVFPAFDLRRSGTRKEELLLTEKERIVTHALRGAGLTDQVARLIDVMQSCKDEDDFIARVTSGHRGMPE